MSKKIKILKTEIINDNKKSIKTRPFLRLTKKKLVFLTVSLLLIISLLLIPKDYYKSSIRKILAYAGIYTEEIKSIEIESNDYNNPGSFKITKSAKWLSTNKVQITFDVDSVIKTRDNYKDIIIVLDISGSMDGEKLTKALANIKGLLNTLLSDTHNRVALITFNSTSEILSTFTNDKESILGFLDNITASGSTNYNAALQNIDTIMTDYTQQDTTDTVALFITDGYPNDDTPSEKATYSVLKDKYSYLTINGIQYEMGKDIIDELKDITDIQYATDISNLNNILIKASLDPYSYEKLIIEDYINTDYFNITSTDDINTSQGTVNIEEASGEKKVVWNLGDNSYVTGSNKTMTIDLTLNDTLPSNKTFFPTNTKEIITYQLTGEEEQTKSSTDTPVLTNKYSVIYNTNTPDGCTLESIQPEEYEVYSNITINDNSQLCQNYLFKGWEITEADNKDITFVNSNTFIMPGHDVTIRAKWTNQSISKSMNGSVKMKASLYNVLKDESENGGLAREYTGDHHDSFTEEPSQKIYHWYASNNNDGTAIQNKNNVIFAGQCFQIIRTTDTGGVKMIYNGEAENDQCLNTRGNNIGYSTRTTLSLNNNFWYGTDYEYDNVNNLFSLSGNKEQTIWNETTWQSLIGKYTCRKTNESGTCSTLYLVESYNSTNDGNLLPIAFNSHYSQFGSIQFNESLDSPAYAGYMYGDIYRANNITNTNTEYVSDNIKLIETAEIDPSLYFYGSNLSYTSGKYTINNSIKLSDNTSDGVGKTVLLCTDNCQSGTTISSATAYYIVDRIDDNNYYTKKLVNGKKYENYKMYIADSTIQNNNGYTLSGNITQITLSDWYNNYSNYVNKYICSDTTKSTCTTVLYIYSNDNQSYNYISYYGQVDNNILLAKNREGTTLTETLIVNKNTWSANYSNYSDYKYTCNNTSNECSEDTLRYIVNYNKSGYIYVPNRYFGSSIEWNGTYYTLQNTIDVEKYNSFNDISTHHYFCLEKGQKTCTRVAYIYSYSDIGNIYYVILNNGTISVSEVLRNMLEKNTSNSIIKSGVEAWYKKYLLKYDDYVEDTIYCNERSIKQYGGWKDDGGQTNLILHFREYPATTNLNCTKTTDKFSISNPEAELTYKTALITTPELTLLNNNNVRKTGKEYWLLSPRLYTAADTRNSRVIEDGTINYTPVHVIQGLRPAISLKPGIEYETGDGSMEHPYIVSIEE